MVCALLCVGMACSVAFSQYRVIGYYPMWSRAQLPPVEVKFASLTHLMHAFAWPNGDASIATSEAVVDTAIINATHRAGRKILLSFGGAGATQTANIAAVVADSLLRRAYVANIVAHLEAYHYDGADLDWEGPWTLADRANEVAFVRELHAAFQAADTNWLLTMAVGVSDYSGKWHDFTTLMQYVDWFNAMTYDFHGSWSSHAGHNAPLYAPASDAGDWSVAQGIAYLHLTRSIPSTQIVLGLPFYGREFQASALYGPKTEPTVDILYSDVPGKLANNWIYHWDAVSMVPYLSDPANTRLDSFDDTTSLTLKCNYAKSNKLSGVMIWEITQDRVGGEHPLLDAVGKAVTGTSAVAPPSMATVAQEFVLLDNYPNPFNPSTTIGYILPARSDVHLAVYTTLGQEVARLAGGVVEAGLHEVRFEGSGLSSGVYFCRLQARPLEGENSGAFVQTKRLIIIK